MFSFRQNLLVTASQRCLKFQFHSWSLLRNDIVSFRFLGYMGDLRIELQAPVLSSTCLGLYIM